MIRSYETAAGPYFLLMFDNIKHFAKLQGNFAYFCGRVTSNPFIHLCRFFLFNKFRGGGTEEVRGCSKGGEFLFVPCRGSV